MEDGKVVRTKTNGLIEDPGFTSRPGQISIDCVNDLIVAATVGWLEWSTNDQMVQVRIHPSDKA